MTIYIPRIFDLKGDPEKIKYTSQNIRTLAEQKTGHMIAFVDNAGKGHFTYQAQDMDANFILTFYASTDNRFQSVACTYTTAAALCCALAKGTSRNIDEAIRLICERNSLCETLILMPMFSYSKILESEIGYDEDLSEFFVMMDSLKTKAVDPVLYEKCVTFRLMYMNPDFMRPLIVEPYDKLQMIDGKPHIIYGDIPPNLVPYKDDVLAAIFNSCAITYYYTSTHSNMPDVEYKTCAALLRRAFYMSTSLAAKAWIYCNLEELKDYCEKTESNSYISAVYSELRELMDKLNEEEHQKSRNTTPQVQAQVSQPVTSTKSDISDKEMITKYLAVIHQNEVQRYRLSEQISSLAGIENISSEELKPFYESKNRYDYNNNQISEQELFLKNQVDFEKWIMSYWHIKKNETKLVAKKEYYIATAEQLRQLHQETGEVLQRLYGYNVIPQKYRTLIAVSTLYEYFQNGRVDSLKEAINLFEQEVRQQIVIDSIQNLSEAVKDMHQSITRNQQMLYSAVCDTNASIQRLSNEISSLSEAYVQNTNKSQELMKASIAQSSIIAKDAAAIRDSVQWIELYHYYFSNLK